MTALAFGSWPVRPPQASWTWVRGLAWHRGDPRPAASGAAGPAGGSAVVCVCGLLRYGLTSDGAAALHNIWGMRNPAEMAALSLAVTCGYAVVATAAAIRIFARQGVQ